jgi:hypothetical protein
VITNKEDNYDKGNGVYRKFLSFEGFEAGGGTDAVFD